MKFALQIALLSLVAMVIGSTAAAAGSKVYYTYVSEYGMNAKLEAKYDFASCTGIRRYGSQSLNTAQWGWVRGYRRFKCMYTRGDVTCFDGQFEANVRKTNGRWGNWYPQLLSRGRCY